MAEVLPNPVLKDDDAEGARLLAAAEKQDLEGIPEPVPAEPLPPREGASGLTPSSDDLAGDKPAEPEKVESTAEPARDELGRFTKADGTKSEPNEVAPKKEQVLNTESDFAKKKKEAERRDRSWQALEAEKQAVRQQAAEIEAQKRALEQQRLAPAQSPETEEFPSRTYENYAKETFKLAREQMARGEVDEAAGNFDLATKAQAKAAQVREVEQKAQFDQQRAEFEQTWRRNMDATIKEVPELADRESPFGKELVQLFQQEPVFNYLPDGFKKAAEIVKLRLAAAKSDTLEAENKQLKTELAKYQRWTSLDGGSPTQHVSPKKFEDMSMEEMGAYLARASENRGIAA